MNVLIYGYGLNEGGYTSALYFLNKGYKVRITDLRDEKSLGESVQILKKMGVKIIAGANRVEDFEWADLVIKAPSIPNDNPFLDYAKTVQNEFSYMFENENVAKIKLICIAGTKDKTITTAAVCHALNAMGKKARTCGTPDSPVFSELENWENGDIPEYLVCKVSSWQIRDSILYGKGFIPEVELAAITSVNPNINYEIFGKQTKCLLCSKDNIQQLKSELNINLRKLALIESNISGFSKELPTNLSTAYAVLKRLGFTQKNINSALKSFKGVPHRVEIVHTKENLLVIDDSTTTIPLAVNFTLTNLISNQVHLICGGSDQHLNADPMLEACKSVSSVTLLDGAFTQKRLIPLLKKNNIAFKGPFKNMNEAVQASMQNIDDSKKILQVILLCPGAPATEFFKSESDRGNQFQACFK